MKIQNISLSSKDKITLFDNFATMLGAGISILEAVDSMLEDSKGNQKKLLENLRKDLTQGQQISSSFARYPGTFDKVTLNIIRASEEAGTLDVTLKDIKKHIQKEMEFKDKIQSAMIYPSLILVVFVGIMLLILTFVIPKMASVFSRMKVELPLATQIMLNVSNFITTYPIQLIIGVIAFIAGFIYLFRTKKSFILGIFFSLPMISGLVKQIDITRFTRSMSLLLSAGIPLTGALELSQEVVSRKDMRQLVKHIQTAVMSGKDVSDAVRDAKGLVPMIVIKLIEAGEKTGSLDVAMQNISENMDYEVQRTLTTLTALLEPIMLIFIGIAVGGMMISIISPIYGLIGQVRNL
ncbi:hypothetical protein COU87_03830 [Candidatus Roizmanbacteria bacterium CG10_big_fil_rev_8_21_14_0_10_39_12]|uniref:Type II secretion system protein GspF domain-containing protein n=2 Tax=Candidatus Roizmaniibacteriota TaxID=1752723 RepID=A0A2M8KNT2_9BACT|nr:MAG: hypothetical protein COY15_01335 [Candidatus Roizmanbacteria bacterium CG_4_10_14_0_2_um_filter_39_12]PJE61575.1 MAG: hypothetical protein COU87_03830 [Candidatus Roizmanbacteria bacterium CG10_big_fil_rev_8_21_14_0_10_39_12]